MTSGHCKSTNTISSSIFASRHSTACASTYAPEDTVLLHYSSHHTDAIHSPRVIIHLLFIYSLVVASFIVARVNASSSSTPPPPPPASSSLEQFESSSEMDTSAISNFDSSSSEYTSEIISLDSPSKCLIAQNVDRLCEMSSSERLLYSNTFYLSFCSMYSLKVLTNAAWLNSPYDDCQVILKSLLQNDTLAGNVFLQFDQLLSRYNCQSGYSVRWNCSHCSKVYREWICSSVLSFYSLTDGHIRRPCENFCEKVQARCPYFHPASGDQYAGEPAFLCADAHIPLLTSQISPGRESECYSLGDLQISRDNKSEIEEMEDSCKRNDPQVYSVRFVSVHDNESSMSKCRSSMQDEAKKGCESTLRDDSFAPPSSSGEE